VRYIDALCTIDSMSFSSVPNICSSIDSSSDSSRLKYLNHLHPSRPLVLASTFLCKVDNFDSGASRSEPQRESQDLSRGRSMNTGFARSRSAGGSGAGGPGTRARSRSTTRGRSVVRVGASGSRGIDAPSAMEDLMSEGAGTRRFTRTRGTEEPSKCGITGGALTEDCTRRRTTAEMLNSMAEDEDDVEPEHRRMLIRFA
jgi:hypothetical protein